MTPRPELGDVAGVDSITHQRDGWSFAQITLQFTASNDALRGLYGTPSEVEGVQNAELALAKDLLEDLRSETRTIEEQLVRLIAILEDRIKRGE